MNSNMSQGDRLKSTIVSLYPLSINEHKPGLYPGYFYIPAAPEGDLSFLVVGDAIFYSENKNDRMVAVTTPFHVLADSIVNDFMVNHIGRVIGENGPVAEPAVFYVPGAWRDKETIKIEFAEEIENAHRKQMNWFGEIIKIADEVFARTSRHSSVSELCRIAARRLNIQRPWTIDVTGSDKCPFCKTTLPYGAVKCPNCREVVDRTGYETLVKQNEETVQEVNKIASARK